MSFSAHLIPCCSIFACLNFVHFCHHVELATTDACPPALRHAAVWRWRAVRGRIVVTWSGHRYTYARTRLTRQLWGSLSSLWPLPSIRSGDCSGIDRPSALRRTPIGTLRCAQRAAQRRIHRLFPATKGRIGRVPMIHTRRALRTHRLRWMRSPCPGTSRQRRRPRNFMNMTTHSHPRPKHTREHRSNDRKVSIRLRS